MNITKNRFVRMAVITAVMLVCLAMTAVPALGYSYTTDNYDVYITVNEDNSYIVTEKISVDFGVEKHGIFRYIPYGNFEDMGYMKVDEVYVDGWNYEAYTEDGNMVVQIGDADETVIGPQVYKMSYEMIVHDDRDESRDFFYVDVIPTDWETPIEASSIIIKFPKDIDAENIKIYSGYYGSEDADALGVVGNYDEASRTLTISSGYLQHGYGITVLCQLPEGYWVGEAGYGWAKTLAAVLGIAVPAVIMICWLLFGRDKKIVPTVEFYPPEGMTPAEVGVVIDNTANKKDLISLIMYLADKGYISIEQIGKKDFVVKKTAELGGDEKNFVRTFYLGLFRKGDEINLDELDEEFGENYLTAFEQLNGHFYKKKNIQMTIKSAVLQILGIVFMGITMGGIVGAASWYSAKVAPVVLAIFALVAVVIAVVGAMVREDKRYVMKAAGKVTSGVILWCVIICGNLLYAYMVCVVMFESSLLAGIFAVMFIGASIAIVLMRQRTKKGVELMGKILGLKNFIEAAELDRINTLVEENPNYFYNILPYAYVMGLTDKWAKNFESIKIQQPTWYTSSYGNYDMFDVWLFSRMMNNCGSAMTSNIHIPVSNDSGSGGGGFSGGGGGFSGGGFGGGGGGSW